MELSVLRVQSLLVCYIYNMFIASTLRLGHPRGMGR